MQEIDFIMNMVLVLAFLTLYGTVTWGLFRYSTTARYRLWAFGWFIYSIGGIQSAFSSQNLIPLDIVGLACFYVGSTLILDGSRESELNQHRVALYITGVLVLFIAALFSMALNLPYYLIFGFLGLYIAYVCLFSVRIVYGFRDINDMPKGWLIIGLMTWAISWLIYPLVTILPSPFYDIIATLQAAGVIVTGASMLTFFMMTVTHKLEQQYQVSQIMSSLIQHDIRNYIHVSRSALDLIQDVSIVENQWISIASDALEDASLFINEMRDLSGLLARMNNNHEIVPLMSVVDQVVSRVQQEYSLEHRQITINIMESTMIKTCPLFKEILWNIFDNAFKHGSETLYVTEMSSSKAELLLEIKDRSGGIPDDVKDFLNSPESLSRPVAPSIGLGIILIRGLSLMCSLKIAVSDSIEDFQVVGTTYLLRTNRAG
jgi:signal transduction histidine kinase